jgi:hypothetical protein
MLPFWIGYCGLVIRPPVTVAELSVTGSVPPLNTLMNQPPLGLLPMNVRRPPFPTVPV